MDYIGLRIKALRKKKDLTQEKLAEYLDVSFQAVSKWETGVASPDLSLIVPLARLLGCSTDELFGLIDSVEDPRQEELRALYAETQQTGDLKKRYEIANIAVKEYPGNFAFLHWLGEAEWMYAVAFCRQDSDEKKAHLEKAIEHLKRVIEDCDSTEIKNNAIHSIVLPLVWCGRRDEAAEYAKQHPDPGFLLLQCLRGDEWEIHRQKLIDQHLMHLIMALEWGHYSLKSLKAVETVIKVIIDDENYLFYHDKLMHNYTWQALGLTREERYDEAIDVLQRSYYHAVQYEQEREKATEAPIPYTCEIFNRLSYDEKDILRTGTSTLMEDFKEYLNFREFDVLREREDFRALAAL